MRRWSRQQHTFSQAPKPDDSDLGVQGPGGAPTLPELPMPRDSQLLPPISRALLRAARAGCIHIRQGSRAAQDEEKSTTDAEDSAVAHLADRSFTTRKWMTLPKHLEPAEVEFLAKRRPGLPSLYGATAGTDGGSGAASGPMRRTKFQKTDPETGNISIYEAWVPEGHRIEGEITGDLQSIVEQSSVPVKPEAPAPGTIVEGVGIVNAEGVVVAEAGSSAVMTPPKRRPPPPKRKGRGIGKGRKKKVMFAPGEGADAAAVHGVRPTTGNGEDGVKREGQLDGSQMSIDQVGQDEDDEDGDEGDDSDEGDESMMDMKTPDTPQPLPGTDSGNQASYNTPAEQTVDVNMADAVSENQPSIPQLSPLTDKKTTFESQPIVSGASHSEHTSEVNFSALASSGSEKADVTNLNETPALLGVDKTIATTNEPTEVTTTIGRAQNANINLQGKDGVIEPMGELALKKEPDLASEQISATALQPASSTNNSGTPVAQYSSHLQPPIQPHVGVSESEQTIVSNEASIDIQEPKQRSNGSLLHPDTQDNLPIATERGQTAFLGITEDKLGADDAKDFEMGDAPAPEQRLEPNPQPRADSDSPQAPPPTAEHQQSNTTLVESNTAAEAPAITDPTVADPGLLHEPATTVSEGATATSQINPADHTVATRAELEEEPHRKEGLAGDGEPEQLPGSIPETGPSGSM